MLTVKLPQRFFTVEMPPFSPDASTIYQTLNRTLSNSSTRTLSTGETRTISDAMSGLHPQMIRLKLRPTIISVEI